MLYLSLVFLLTITYSIIEHLFHVRNHSRWKMTAKGARKLEFSTERARSYVDITLPILFYS